MEFDDGDQQRAYQDWLLTRYQFLWEDAVRRSPREDRLHNDRGIHVLDATFRNTVLKGHWMHCYIALLPVILLVYVVFSLVAHHGQWSWVYPLYAAGIALTGMMAVDMRNRFRSLLNELKKRNLVFEPMGTWRENVMDLTGDRRKYVHALLGSRALLLTLMKGTSLDLDLEHEDQEISYMVRKIIHMDELDSAITKKAQSYVVRMQELAEENIDTMQFVMDIQNTTQQEQRDKDLEAMEREQRKFLSRKYLAYKPPKNIYDEFIAETG